MAFNLSQRFPPHPPYTRISDPGAYQKVGNPIIQVNKVPFLSKEPRTTQPGNKLWTSAIYNINISNKILNCPVFKSNVPRFPYKDSAKEDIENLLCRCGIHTNCECFTSEIEDKEIICQGKVRRRLFKGPSPRTLQCIHDLKESKKRRTKVQPPFYDATVIESTSYYKGCKWSQWTSKRSTATTLSAPGPADYMIQKTPREEAICDEKVRAYKRKNSKQLRYIEMVQQKNIRDNFPGPGSYNPKEPEGTCLSYLGPKAERFSHTQYDKKPGPSDHWIKRCFDPLDLPYKPCHLYLKGSAPFGSRAVRLKHRFEEGPSPASYDPNFSASKCKYIKCSKAPFGVTSKRFKEDIDNNYENEDNKQNDIKPDDTKTYCLLPTWQFRSETVRMKPLTKKLNEPSPADLPQCNLTILRSARLQTAAPFFTSDDRFRPWYNWIPVQGVVNTPGPGYYSLEIPKCMPAVPRGPLSRSPRFKTIESQTPSPNHYKVDGGIENILETHNERLKGNLRRQKKFLWKPKKEVDNRSFADKENILLNRSIELLNV